MYVIFLYSFFTKEKALDKKDEQKLKWIDECRKLGMDDDKIAFDLVERADAEGLVEWSNEVETLHVGLIKSSEGTSLVSIRKLLESSDFLLRMLGTDDNHRYCIYAISEGEDKRLWERVKKLWVKTESELLQIVKTHDEPHPNRGCDLGCGGHSGPGRP